MAGGPFGNPSQCLGAYRQSTMSVNPTEPIQGSSPEEINEEDQNAVAVAETAEDINQAKEKKHELINPATERHKSSNS